MSKFRIQYFSYYVQAPVKGLDNGSKAPREADCAGLKVAGPTGRFKRALLKKIHQSGGLPALEDEDTGRVLRQCLWQWGYELNQSEYERAMAGE